MTMLITVLPATTCYTDYCVLRCMGVGGVYSDIYVEVTVYLKKQLYVNREERGSQKIRGRREQTISKMQMIFFKRMFWKYWSSRKKNGKV